MLCCILVDMIHECPSGPLWGIRAGIKCSDENMYHCLIDTNAKNTTTGFYVEKCLSPKRYIGKRYVLSGNLNALECDATRYTPQGIWSNNTKNSECPLQKSLCNEEGQIIVENGTTEIDRTCRCNYQESYNYVIMPGNPCKCFPDKEDCSCYVHHCSDPTEDLSPDYECEERDVPKFFTCNTIPLPPTHRFNEPVTTVKTDSIAQSKINSQQRIRHVIFVILGTICILLLAILAIIKEKVLYVHCTYIDELSKQAQVARSKETLSQRKPEKKNFEISYPELIFRGNDVHLDCVIADKSSIYKVSWYFAKKDSALKQIWPENSDKYSGGTTTTPSLLIKGVDETDSGTYRCDVVLVDDTHFTSQRNLCIPEKIYIQDLPVISHYLPVEQVSHIEQAFLEKGKKLVILEGIHGSGKSQAAHYYCMKMKDKYSVIAKILLNNVLPLKEVLENLAADLNFKRDYKKAVDTKIVVENIKACFNQGERKRFPYLLFIDDVDQDIFTDFSDVVLFVSYIKDVPNLHIILATTNVKLKDKFDDYKLVEFNGLTDSEFDSLFSDLEHQKEDICRLRKDIGNMPLVAVTIIRFMITFKFTTKRFLDDFLSKSSEFDVLSSYQTIEETHDTEYDKTTLKSQIIPLHFIKKTLSKNKWNVIQLIPYFRYNNISTTVLEACYFHLTRCTKYFRRREIEALVRAFDEIPLCHVTSLPPARIQVSSSSKSSVKDPDEVLMFHKVTKVAMNILANRSLENYDSLNLHFLLKFFCFEIDIDAVTDVTVDRNLRFVQHAIKLLKNVGNQMEEMKKKYNPKEMQFCTAYLHCAIGTTFFFQRTKIQEAHRHLMKARETALSIVKSKCDFTKENCIYINDENIVPETCKSDIDHTEKVMQDVVNTTFSKEFCKTFVLGKHRNVSDLHALRKEINVKLKDRDSHYFEEEDYEYLLKAGLAMPLEYISQIFLSEILLRILHNNGTILHELTYETNNDEESKVHKMLKKACIREYKTAMILRETIEERFSFDNVELFVCLRNKRSYQAMISLSFDDMKTVSLDRNIQLCQGMLQNKKRKVLDSGIFKFSEKSDIRHTSMCNSVLLRLIMKKLKEEPDSEQKSESYDKGNHVMGNLVEQIEEIESSDLPYTWLILPFLYIVCGKFLLLSPIECNTERALKYFNRALQIEESRSVKWTRFIFEGLLGKIQCLQKLNKEKDALQTINSTIDKLEGQNRDEIYNKFISLRLQIKFRVKM